MSAFACRNALSLFRSSECWDVPGEKRVWDFSVLRIIESNVCFAARRSSRVHRSASSAPRVINMDAISSALRLSRNIACCHVPGATFCLAFSDLLISDAMGGGISCRAFDGGIFMGWVVYREGGASPAMTAVGTDPLLMVALRCEKKGMPSSWSGNHTVGIMPVPVKSGSVLGSLPSGFIKLAKSWTWGSVSTFMVCRHPSR